jgi:Glyoxalase-like domain
VVDRHPDPKLRVASISLDCLDPLALAEFYVGLLDGVELWRSERSVGLRVRGAVLAMQRVDTYQPPTWPGSAVMHLDLTAGDEFDRSEARALQLGATLAKFQPDPRWRVLLDPAGHPFCITTVTPPE